MDHPAFPDTNQSNQGTDYCPNPSEQMHMMLSASMPIEPTTIAPPSTSIANVDQSKVFQCNMPRCKMVLTGSTLTGSECFQVELITEGTNSTYPEHIVTLCVAKKAIKDINFRNVLAILSMIDLNAGSSLDGWNGE